MVTPNMVAATSGLESSCLGATCSSMPVIAATALLKIVAEKELMPATSTMEGNMAISDAPTYGEVSPDAMVDTITLGTPTGSLRMPAVAIAVPPEPPMEKTPSKRPLAYSVGKSFSTPRVMVSVAKARSFFSAMVDISISTAAATSVLVTSGMVCGSNTPQWMVMVLMPSSSKRVLT